MMNATKTRFRDIPLGHEFQNADGQYCRKIGSYKAVTVFGADPLAFDPGATIEPMKCWCGSTHSKS